MDQNIKDLPESDKKIDLLSIKKDISEFPTSKEKAKLPFSIKYLTEAFQGIFNSDDNCGLSDIGIGLPLIFLSLLYQIEYLENRIKILENGLKNSAYEPIQ